VGLVEIFRLTTLEDDIFDPGWYTGISSYPRDQILYVEVQRTLWFRRSIT
jgi:hypothetical protein